MRSSGLERTRRDFKRFKAELTLRNISSEIRVICDKNILKDIHDRWIMATNVCYNVPPINSIYMGQYSELVKTDNRPPFGEWWQKGLNILDDWNDIDKALKN